MKWFYESSLSGFWHRSELTGRGHRTKHRSSRATAFRSSINALYLKRARAKRRQAKGRKKQASVSVSSASATRSRGEGGERPEVSKRLHLVVWGSIVYVKIIKNNKAAVLKTRRVFPRAAMRAGKRAARRKVQKHKLPPRARRLAKKSLHLGIGNKG